MKNTHRIRDNRNTFVPLKGGVSEFLNDFWRFPSFTDDSWGGDQSFLPTLDISETEKEFVIEVDLPGFDPKNVNVEVEDGMIVLNGMQESEKEEKKKNYHRRERVTGSFYRTVKLPPSAELEKIHCRSRHGTLTATVPKKKGTEKRNITIEVEK